MAKPTIERVKMTSTQLVRLNYLINELSITRNQLEHINHEVMKLLVEVGTTRVEKPAGQPPAAATRVDQEGMSDNNGKTTKS